MRMQKIMTHLHQVVPSKIKSDQTHLILTDFISFASLASLNPRSAPQLRSLHITLHLNDAFSNCKKSLRKKSQTKGSDAEVVLTQVKELIVSVKLKDEIKSDKKKLVRLQAEGVDEYFSELQLHAMFPNVQTLILQGKEEEPFPLLPSLCKSLSNFSSISSSSSSSSSSVSSSSSSSPLHSLSLIHTSLTTFIHSCVLDLSSNQPFDQLHFSIINYCHMQQLKHHRRVVRESETEQRRGDEGDNVMAYLTTDDQFNEMLSNRQDEREERKTVEGKPYTQVIEIRERNRYLDLVRFRLRLLKRRDDQRLTPVYNFLSSSLLRSIALSFTTLDGSLPSYSLESPFTTSHLG